MATLGGSSSGCPPMSLGQSGGVICQPPMVSDTEVPLSSKTISQRKNSAGGPLLGFECVVAPINKDENSKHPLHKDKSLPRDVQQLLGGKNATPQVAPSLSTVCRKILEGRKVQDKSITDFLDKNPSLKRYNSAFTILWSLLENSGINPPEASADQLADKIVEIFRVSPAQARNAYSACLILPGVGGG